MNHFVGEDPVSCSKEVHSRWFCSLGVFLFCCLALKGEGEFHSEVGVAWVGVACCLVVVAGCRFEGEVAYSHFEVEVAFVVII
jgi:hypothetical protein